MDHCFKNNYPKKYFIPFTCGSGTKTSAHRLTEETNVIDIEI